MVNFLATQLHYLTKQVVESYLYSHFSVSLRWEWFPFESGSFSSHLRELFFAMPNSIKFSEFKVRHNYGNLVPDEVTVNQPYYKKGEKGSEKKRPQL